MRNWVKFEGLKPGPVRFALLLLLAAAPAAAQETTVLIVRHAEQGVEPEKDPPLNAVGIARAEALRAVLQQAGITAIITSDRARTQLTARPLAEQLGLSAEVTPVSGAGVPAHIAAVVARIRAHAGGTVLVVGHSNTIGEIAEALGTGDIEPVENTVFDNLFIVRIPAEGAVRLIRARYGVPTPPGATVAH